MGEPMLQLKPNAKAALLEQSWKLALNDEKQTPKLRIMFLNRSFVRSAEFFRVYRLCIRLGSRITVSFETFADALIQETPLALDRLCQLLLFLRPSRTIVWVDREDRLAVLSEVFKHTAGERGSLGLISTHDGVMFDTLERFWPRIVEFGCRASILQQTLNGLPTKRLILLSVFNIESFDQLNYVLNLHTTTLLLQIDLSKFNGNVPNGEDSEMADPKQRRCTIRFSNWTSNNVVMSIVEMVARKCQECLEIMCLDERSATNEAEDPADTTIVHFDMVSRVLDRILQINQKVQINIVYALDLCSQSEIGTIVVDTLLFRNFSNLRIEYDVSENQKSLIFQMTRHTECALLDFKFAFRYVPQPVIPPPLLMHLLIGAVQVSVHIDQFIRSTAAWIWNLRHNDA